jgi:hypothetical protein
LVLRVKQTTSSMPSRSKATPPGSLPPSPLPTLGPSTRPRARRLIPPRRRHPRGYSLGRRARRTDRSPCLGRPRARTCNDPNDPDACGETLASPRRRGHRRWEHPREQGSPSPWGHGPSGEAHRNAPDAVARRSGGQCKSLYSSDKDSSSRTGSSEIGVRSGFSAKTEDARSSSFLALSSRWPGSIWVRLRSGTLSYKAL